MGGTTFTNYGDGTDAQEVFSRLTEEAHFESGHGGYSGTIGEKGSFVYITKTPLLMEEAHELADRLIQAADPRIDDKWGPAGAIPVISPIRETVVKDFEYTHPYSDFQKQQQVLIEAVTPLVKLKKGETIESVNLSSYETPRRSGYSTIRTTSERRSKCHARVTINKPPMTRTATVKVTIPPERDWDKRRAAVRAAAEREVKLKDGEKVVTVRERADTPVSPKVVAVAPKEKTETRYIIKGHFQFGEWARGLPTQAAARAQAVKLLENQRTAEAAFYEIEAVTRRVDGQPLVRVAREIAALSVEVEVTVSLAKPRPTTPDGWLFFGWASM